MPVISTKVCSFIGVGVGFEPIDNTVVPYGFSYSINDVQFGPNGEFPISEEVLKGSGLIVTNNEFAVDLDNLPENVEVISSSAEGCMLLIKGDCTIPLILSNI